MTLTVPKSVEIRKNLVGWPKETCRVTSTSRSIIKGPTRRLCVWSPAPSVGAQRRASAAFIPMSAAPNAARITPPGGVAVIRHVIGQVAGLTAVRTSSPQVGTQSRSAESAQAARAAAVTSSGGSVIRAWLHTRELRSCVATKQACGGLHDPSPRYGRVHHRHRWPGSQTPP